MVNTQLLEYIRQQLTTGISKEEISKSLVASGWQVSDINEAFNVPASPQVWKKMKLTDPINPKAISVMASVGSVILFLVGLIVLGAICLFLRGLSTFQFDSTASFYPSADLFISLVLLFVIPIAVLVRSLRKNRTVFSIQAAIYVVILSIGIISSYMYVSSSWQNFCVSQADQATSLKTFYQEYCKSHPAPILAIFDHTMEAFLGVGGVGGNYLFESDNTGKISGDVMPYIDEARKAGVIYAQNTAVPVTLTCNYTVDGSLYDKNLPQGMDVMGDGTFALVTSANNSKDVDYKNICLNILPKTVSGTRWDGAGYGGCPYDIQASGTIKVESLMFNNDPKEYKNVSCLRSLQVDTSTFVFKDFHVDGLP